MLTVSLVLSRVERNEVYRMKKCLPVRNGSASENMRADFHAFTKMILLFSFPFLSSYIGSGRSGGLLCILRIGPHVRRTSCIIQNDPLI